MTDTPPKQQPDPDRADKFTWKPGDVQWVKRKNPLPEGERWHPDAEQKPSEKPEQ